MSVFTHPLFQLGYWYQFWVLKSLVKEINEPPQEVQDLPHRGKQAIHRNRGQKAPGGQGQVIEVIPGQNPAALTGEHKEKRNPPGYIKNGQR